MTTNKDLDRLLELYLNYINWIPKGELPKEYHDLYESLSSKLNDAEIKKDYIERLEFVLQTKGLNIELLREYHRLKQKLANADKNEQTIWNIRNFLNKEIQKAQLEMQKHDITKHNKYEDCKICKETSRWINELTTLLKSILESNN